MAAALSIGFVACNNDADDTASTDSTTTENTATTTTTSTGTYAAQAETYKTNSDAGNYLDAKTGKPIRITVDPNTGARTNAETNEPVWYYVDRTNWWVYGPDSWDTIGTARMEGDNLVFRDDNDKWVGYDKKKWKVDDDGDMKMKDGDTKIKIDKDGDTKIKTGDSKTKTKADSTN